MTAFSRSAAVLVLLLGVAIAWRRTPSPDVLWLLDVAGRVARGEVLYRDILQINPPLITWLLVPFARTAHPLSWFVGAVILLAAASAAAAARALRRAPLAVAAGYALLVAALAPDYFGVVRTLGGDYLAYQPAGAAELLWANPTAWVAVLGPAAWLATRASTADRALGDGLAVATLGFLAGAVVQGKGWNYHYAPAVTTSVLQLLLVSGQALRPAVLLVRCVTAALLTGLVHQGLSRRPLPAGAEAASADPAAYRRLVAALGDAGHPRSLLALYRRSGLAFTLSAYGGARFVSPFPMLWVFDVPGWQAKLPWWTGEIARAARRDPPDLVLLSRDSVGGADCAEVLSRDARIAELLRDYEPRPDAAGYRVYVRRSGAGRSGRARP